ncbi:MAG: hypothetical protein K2X99_09320 [Gemmatimonadaceae bacterium]|nr:hypothetical protein [Gemmatimonadaceae bacterium]
MTALAVAAPTPSRDGCEGRRITAIGYRHGAPSVPARTPGVPDGAQRIANRLLVGTPTVPAAIRPFLLFREGDWCLERRRSESERLLRLLPYIADATIHAEPDGPDGVRLDVVVFDDVRSTVELLFDGATPRTVAVTNRSVGGRGQLVRGSWTRGTPFRSGVGGTFRDYHLMGQPVTGTVTIDRFPLGGYQEVSAARPLLSDEQWSGWRALVIDADHFLRYRTASGERPALRVRRQVADLDAVARISSGPVRWFAGGEIAYDRIRPDADGVLIADEGLVAPTDPALAQRYPARSGVRIGPVLGVRALSFVKVRGFDALAGAQDLGRGVQFVARALHEVTGAARQDLEVQGFAGRGDSLRYAAWQGITAVRQRSDGRSAVVATGRLAAYRHPTASRTSLLQFDYAAAWRSDLPFQLSFADRPGALRGFEGSRATGGQRVTLLAEHRELIASPHPRLALAVAGFMNAGRIWAVDVPYGSNATRASVGASLIGASPRNSRSSVRLDLAVPLTPDPRVRPVNVRVAFSIVPRRFWIESEEIRLAHRAGPVEGTFVWP